MPWLTWQQAGDRFGLTPDAVRMRARRLGWRTQPGNEGRTLVEIPDDAEVKPRERAAERVIEHSTEGSAEQTASIARMTELLLAAEARAERADLRAEKAEQRAVEAERRADEGHALADRTLALLADAGARADRAEAAVSGERQRADALRDRVDGLQAEVDAARERSSFSQAAMEQAQAEAKVARYATEALQRAETERKARGLVARLRQAWRGE